MGSIPLLSAAQWGLIGSHLPANRRDRHTISAILYREHSGQSLRHVADQYGLSRVRLHEWHRAIEADGSLARIMKALKLVPAGPLVRRGGGRPFYSHNPAMVAQVTAIRLQNFREALQTRRR